MSVGTHQSDGGRHVYYARSPARDLALWKTCLALSSVRPESAVSQALDYVFCHDVGQVARYLPSIRPFFEGDPARADAWTLELRQAYARRKIDREPARRLLEEAGVPPSRNDARQHCI